jgi:hypothetical protein
MLHSFLQNVARGGVFDTHSEEIDEKLKTILIHRVDRRQINDAKEQKGGSKRNGPIRLSSLVDLRFRNSRVFHSLVNFGCKFLRSL